MIYAPNTSAALNPSWVDEPEAMPCPYCNGSGRTNLSGQPLTDEDSATVRCTNCGGCGEVEAK